MDKLEVDLVPEEAIDEDQEKLRDELIYFKEIKNELLQDARYNSKFVAIKDKQVIAVGTDEFKLARKVMKEYPGEIVLIRLVVEHPPVVDLGSPEVLL